MANVRILNNEDFDSATLTSSLAMSANTPISNLQIGLRAKIARTSTGGTWVISGTYPLAKAVSAVSLYKHNFSSAANMTLRLYSDAGLTSQIGSDYTASLRGYAKPFGLAFQPAGWGLGGVIYGYETFESWPASYFTLWLSDTVYAVMGFKITIVDSSLSYYEVGRIYMGETWSPEINASYGANMSWEEQSKQIRTDGGSLRTEGYQPYRAFSLSFDRLTDSERTVLVNMFRKLGLRKDFFISIFPEVGGELEKDYTSAVKLTQMPKISTPYFDNYTTSIELEEI